MSPSASPSVSPSESRSSSSPPSPPQPFHPAPDSPAFDAPSFDAPSLPAADRSTSADAPPRTFRPPVAAHSPGPGLASGVSPPPPDPAVPGFSSILRRSARSASCSAATRSSSAWNASRLDVTSFAAFSFSETFDPGPTEGEPGGFSPPGRPRRGRGGEN